MGDGLVIIEPTTVLRDWTRGALDLDEIWAGGWPQTSAADTGIVLEVINSTLRAPVTTWSLQWDCYAPTQPVASALAARLATLLVRTPTRELIGTTPDGSVLYGGTIEGSVSLFPVPPDDGDPDVYRHTLLCDLLTIAVPTPTP